MEPAGAGLSPRQLGNALSVPYIRPCLARPGVPVCQGAVERRLWVAVDLQAIPLGLLAGLRYRQLVSALKYKILRIDLVLSEKLYVL